MAKANENRIIVRLKSAESGYTYVTVKNKKNDQERMELRKYDPVLRKHTLFKEAR